jgi:hypothetical protein
VKNTVKLGTWTAHELKVLRKLFPGSSTRDVATALGRPVEAVKKKAERLGLTKNLRRRKELGRA